MTHYNTIHSSIWENNTAWYSKLLEINWIERLSKYFICKNYKTIRLGLTPLAAQPVQKCICLRAMMVAAMHMPPPRILPTRWRVCDSIFQLTPPHCQSHLMNLADAHKMLSSWFSIFHAKSCKQDLPELFFFFAQSSLGANCYCISCSCLGEAIMLIQWGDTAIWKRKWQIIFYFDP